MSFNVRKQSEMGLKYNQYPCNSHSGTSDVLINIMNCQLSLFTKKLYEIVFVPFIITWVSTQSNYTISNQLYWKTLAKHGKNKIRFYSWQEFLAFYEDVKKKQSNTHSQINESD